MSNLNSQKRFNQLVLFLEDPQLNPHPSVKLDSSIFLEGKTFSKTMVQDCMPEAIEIMKSDLFRDGCLKGTKRNPDIKIKKLEQFILQVACAVHHAKLRLKCIDGRRELFDIVQEAFLDAREAFNKAAHITRENKLLRKDKLIGHQLALIKLMTQALNKVKSKNDFDLVNELLFIFKKHFPKAPTYLISTRIYELTKKHSGKKVRDLLSIDGICKRLISLQ